MTRLKVTLAVGICLFALILVSGFILRSSQFPLSPGEMETGVSARAAELHMSVTDSAELNCSYRGSASVRRGRRQ